MSDNTRDTSLAAERIALEWASDPRWAHITRDYTTDAVAGLPGRVTEEHTPARRGAGHLRTRLTADAAAGG